MIRGRGPGLLIAAAPLVVLPYRWGGLVATHSYAEGLWPVWPMAC